MGKTITEDLWGVGPPSVFLAGEEPGRTDHSLYRRSSPVSEGGDQSHREGAVGSTPPYDQLQESRIRGRM